MKRQNEVTTMVYIAIFSALMFVSTKVLQFPFPMANFLKIEISAAIVLILYRLRGFWPALIMISIVSILPLILEGTQTMFVGEVTFFLAESIFLFLYVVGRKLWVKQSEGYREVSTLIFSTIMISIIFTILNFFVIFPIYIYVMGYNFGMEAFSLSYTKYIISVFMSFNLLKYGLSSLVYFAVLKVLPAKYVKIK